MLCSLVGLFVLPLTLYAYLPLAGMGEPPVYWGAPGKWATFWEHITGKAYHGALASSAEVIFYNARKYAGYFMSQYGWWFLWLLPVGMASLWQNRERRTLLLLLLYIAAVNIAYSVHYNIFDIYVYYLPSYLITAALLAVGAVKAMTWMWDRRGLDAPSRLHYARLAAIVALTYPIVQMSLHYAQTDKSRNFLEQDFSANVLRSAPENALVISGSNLVFSLWYQRFVLGEREDVVPINWSMTRGMFLYDAWYYRHLKRLYPDIKNTYASGTATIEQAANGDFLIAMIKRAVQKDVAVILVNDIGSRSVLFTEKLNREFDRVPWGIGERVYFKGRTPSAGEIVRANEALYTGWGHADPMQQHITLRYADAGLALGKMAEKAGRYQTASEAYRSTLRLYRSDDAEAGLARCSQALSAAPRQVSQAPRNRSVQR